jgi:menaquinone-9 beta-reductase
MNNNARMPDLTLIVGGGPAGASCAWKLASSGIPCKLFDKAVFPRDKVCGGALSSRAGTVLIESGLISKNDLKRLTLKEHRTLSLWNRGEHLRTYTSQSDPVRIISRKSFDSLLLEKAAEAGAEIITGNRVSAMDDSTVTLSSGERIPFLNIVGADGCGSLVQRHVHIRKRRKAGIGMEYLIPVSDLEEFSDALHIHFGYIKYGYIWVFPDKEWLNIGAGAVGSPATPSDVIGALKVFMETLGLSCHKYQLRAASIPSLSLDRNLGTGNVYLAGDAAGTVDQVSGEGIGHAIESGFMVADCIRSGGDRRTLHAGKKVSCISIVRQSTFFRHLLFSPLTEGTAMMGLRDNISFARGYWNIISGRESYTEMFGRLLR